MMLFVSRLMESRDIWDQFMVNQTQFSQDSLGVGFQEVGVNI